MKYRREVDGLRAVAVVPVIFFHAGFKTLSGGFVGVDVFFVISGYLITSIILAEQQAGTFTLLKFYERRARRILPPLFLVLFACIPFAWRWLLPYDMKTFSQSLIAVCAFASNILFWRTSGYFETASELKPLLHTWSLAVEEQYYVFFPLLLMLTWRLGKRWILALLVIIASISLLEAELNANAYPSFTFYSLQTRAWELMVGAFVAFYMLSPGRPPFRQWLNEPASALGLALIAYAVFAFNSETLFPGVHALYPTAGAALVILFATPQTVTGKVLGSRVLVGIGLISYSAYLWHQPLFAFARLRDFDPPDKATMACLAIVSLGLAYLTRKFVENPFRDRRKFTRKQIFVYAAACTSVVLAVGLAGQLTKGRDGRFTAAQGEFLGYFDNSFPDYGYAKASGLYEEMHGECDFFDVLANWRGHSTNIPKQTAPSCYTRNPAQKHAVLIWGDSHAQQFYFGLKNTLPDDWQILQVASSGCAPSFRYDPNSNNYCDHSNYFAYKTIVETRPDVVVVGQERGHNAEAMREIAEKFAVAGVRRVIFAGPSPHWKRGGLPALIVWKLWDHTPRRTAVGLDEQFRENDSRLKTEVAASPSVRYVSLFDYFCGAQGCLVYYGDDVKAGITTFDYGHLTAVASLHFAKDVLAPAVMAGAP